MCCCPDLNCILKVVLGVLVLFGGALIGIGIWWKLEPEFWNIQFQLDVTQFSKAAWVAIACGAVILAIGLIGFCGASKESPCLLSMVLLLLAIVIILQIVIMAVVWALVNDKDFSDQISEKLRQEMKKESGEVTYFMNKLQTKLECCGVTSYKDYLVPPRSCYKPDTTVLWDKGCLEAVSDYLKGKAVIIGGVSVSLLALEIGAMVLLACIMCGIRSAKR